MIKKLIYQDERSSKFWNIETRGKNFTVTFGKIGTEGQSQTKEFESEDICKKAIDKLINEKLNKGYVELRNLSLIENAKEIVNNYPITEGVHRFSGQEIYYFNGKATLFLKKKKLSMEILSQCLHYFIHIDCLRITDEKKVKLGVSKIMGLPHLPASIQWPHDYYFYAQLNLKELTKYDVEKMFPADGMLYIFFDQSEDENKCRILFYNGTMDSLSIVPYPKKEMYYKKKFINNSSTIKFIPHFIFYLQGDANNYNEIAELIDDKLKLKISETLGCDIANHYNQPNIFGRPKYYQGEDECTGKRKMDNYLPNNFIMLFQDKFGEGAIHFWIRKEALKEKDFSKCFVTYSGT
jgi:predicted DNA-binding WGR domain protein/uncharacterized protein YwqG